MRNLTCKSTVKFDRKFFLARFSKWLPHPQAKASEVKQSSFCLFERRKKKKLLMPHFKKNFKNFLRLTYCLSHRHLIKIECSIDIKHKAAAADVFPLAKYCTETVSCIHRYLRKADCSNFVLCLLPTLALPRFFCGGH